MALLEAWIIFSSIVAIWPQVREVCSYAFLSGRVPIIVVLIITLWLMSWNHGHFGRLRHERADRWKKAMRRNVDYIVLLLLDYIFYYNLNNNYKFILNDDNKSMCSRTKNKSMWLIALANIVVIIGNQSHDYLINHNKLMWLIALANMMVLIHVIYNHQLSFYFYGTNDGVGRRLGHRVALKSVMGAAAATNKGVEILAAAIDSSMTGGVATSAIHSLRLVLDSGATRHVVGDKSILQGYRELANPETGILPDDSTVSMTGAGTIQTEHFTITDVRFVKDLSVNLISVSQLYRQYGMGAWFIRGRCGVMLNDGTTAGGGVLENDRLYVLTNLHVPAGPVEE